MRSLNMTVVCLLSFLLFLGSEARILLNSECSCHDRTVITSSKTKLQQNTTTDCSFLRLPVVQGQDLCSSSSTWNFRGNYLRKLPRYPFTGKLDISKNEFGLDKRWIAPQSLNELDASDNYFADLKFLEPLYDCALNILNVSNNLITKLDKAHARCRYIREFRIANNKLTQLTNDSFSNQELLTFLDLSGNPLRSVSPNTFSVHNNLLTLDMSNTQLSDLPAGIFSELTLLQHLHLSGSNFTKLPADVFRSLKGLVTLYLQRNAIRELQPGIFDSLFQLKVLDLDNNRLEHLPASLFQRLHSLQHLSARSNRLRTLPALRLCAAPLRTALFASNAIAAVGEDELRALWRPGFQLADVTDNPVEASSLQWAHRAPDVQVFTEGSLIKIGLVVMDRGIVRVQN